MKCPKCSGYLISEEIVTEDYKRSKVLRCLNCGKYIQESIGVIKTRVKHNATQYKKRLFRGNSLPIELRIKIKKLRDEGLTYQAIGDIIGVSNQTVMNVCRKG